MKGFLLISTALLAMTGFYVHTNIHSLGAPSTQLNRLTQIANTVNSMPNLTWKANTSQKYLNLNT
jgi:hypothetical protein